MGGSSVSIDLSHTHEDLSLTLEPMSKSLNAVVHVCNPGAGKAERLIPRAHRPANLA